MNRTPSSRQGTATYLNIKWEVDRYYLPQINSLQALRAKLVAP